MKTISIPRLKKLTDPDQLNRYGETYFQCSGLAVPSEYLNSGSNRVYGIFYKKEMMGGFILGSGKTLRTLEVFAQPPARQRLYERLGEMGDFTEITCFWIARQFRKNVWLNTFVWLCLGFTLRRFGSPKVIFGTCSASLARLYSVSKKVQLVHEDFVNGKRTFIYWGGMESCAHVFREIIAFKLGRTLKIQRERPRLLQQAA